MLQLLNTVATFSKRSVLKIKILHLCSLLIVVLTSVNTYAGIALGQTRVIYDGSKKEVELSVSNNNKDSNYLIQSYITKSNNKKTNDFIITPPLFVMKGKEENLLRIVGVNKESLAKDRESLYWVNVKAIPSLSEKDKGKNIIQIAINNRIKLFYRPHKFKITPIKAQSMIKFSRSRDKITISNPTPYYITIINMDVGKGKLEPTMVAPYSEHKIDNKKNYRGKITYQTINDYGGTSDVIKAGSI
ncbi:hypothetical protein C0W92_08960 [Photobacterium angustum]|uniref:Fimbrial chaperone protein n=1 Tax=Photobacterium angustum TaxID=661 RepID=A0A855SCV0_PHOAN|nr:hypothetical protein C0W92_08960 [Photobacterium angustum]PSX07708.1 hypothetical protein C0W41_10720 [Photobacterium angustum]PSX15476.1 hypothetical protein C0W55_05820 [Photobacterium angustum]PSX23968.1 hypothetical protein C0W36_07120 [Photobacterium angustum]PSX39630.1 hypothetical protein C0W34_17395 [Photobacterium angustum]